MREMVLPTSRKDDPRRLRELLERASGMASGHSVSSVVVGIAGLEGDLLFPEVVYFIESALRVDDAIFRMTRERAVLVLSDVDRTGAENIVSLEAEVQQFLRHPDGRSARRRGAPAHAARHVRGCRESRPSSVPAARRPRHDRDGIRRSYSPGSLLSAPTKRLCERRGG